jgi:uncharacterized protein with PIN domain
MVDAIIFYTKMERKFIVDFMLGRLCRWLRLIGEDAEYYAGSDKGGIIYRSLKDRRIILTRDTHLSSRKALRTTIIQSDNFRDQLKQVISEYDIHIEEKKIYTRCTLCNNPLEGINKEKIKGKVPDYVYETRDDFALCNKCKKLYWKGTHRELMKDVLEELKE